MPQGLTIQLPAPPSTDPIPAGEYVFEVEKSEFTQPDDPTKKSYFLTPLVVVADLNERDEDDDQTGRRMPFNSFYTSERALPIISTYLDVLGYEIDPTEKVNIVQLMASTAGKHFIAPVKFEPESTYDDVDPSTGETVKKTRSARSQINPFNMLPVPSNDRNGTLVKPENVSILERLVEAGYMDEDELEEFLAQHDDEG